MSTKYGYFQGQKAKFVYRNNGKVDVYFGSGPTGDGPGHGHVVIDSSDAVRYWREPGVSHANYGIDDTKNNHTKF